MNKRYRLGEIEEAVSEMEELIGVCDRIYVMAKGRIAGELARKDFSQENIMKLALKG